MTDETKLTLSAKELDLVCNTQWILTKHAIIEKVYDLFGVLANEMPSLFKQQNNLPAEVIFTIPKISKGENYRLLPYVMLDYPRLFSKEDSFAIRCFFWWGNFFSINLQLEGSYKNKALPALAGAYDFFKNNHYQLCIHADPWQHYFEAGNFTAVNELTYNEYIALLQEKTFVKLTKTLPLQQWDAAYDFFNKAYREMQQIMQQS